ncbi:zinc ribbon domain-containing protein [candidate division KSB1 bacterium]
MVDLNYRCPKCGFAEYDVGEFRAAGGFWSKIFDVQGARFTTVTCKQCTFTDIYKTKSSTLGNVFDLFTN